jgi:hypothetical protein
MTVRNGPCGFGVLTEPEKCEMPWHVRENGIVPYDRCLITAWYYTRPGP